MLFKKKKKQRDPFHRIRKMVQSDPDLEWYCPECNATSEHLGGTWIDCPTHLQRDDGRTRKMHAITRYVCQWCGKSINIDTVRDSMGMCKHCNEFVPVRAFQRDLEKAVLDILRTGDKL